MRHEPQNWNEVTVRVEIISAGTAITGLAPTCILWRKGDNKWFDPASGYTSAAPVNISMTEFDATNFPGLYTYVVPTTYNTEPAITAAALPVYIARIIEATHTVLEYVTIETVVNPWTATTATYGGLATTMGNYTVAKIQENVWDSLRAAHVVSGSFGEYVNIPISDASIALKVWQENISAQTTYTEAGAVLAKLGFETGISEYNEGDNRHVCDVGSVGTGKFYATATCPAPSVAVAESYNGRIAVLYSSVDKRNYTYVIASVGTDGSGNFFQLELQASGGGFTRTITTTDQLFPLNEKYNDLSIAGVWSESVTGYTTPGTFGESFRRMLYLRQENMKIVYTAWNAADVPTAGTVYIYPSKAILDADTGDTGAGSMGSYAFTGTFTSLKPTRYISTKTT